MRIIPTLRLWKNKALHLTGLNWSLKNQSFDLNQAVFVTNHSSKSVNTSLIIPIPQQNPTQKLLSEIKSSYPNTHLKKEVKLKNTYSVTNLTLNPRQTLEIELLYKVSINPTTTNISTDTDLRDYSPKTLNKYSEFLKPNQFLDNQNKDIIALKQKLIGGETKILKILSIFNSYIIAHLKYGNPILGLYTAGDALTLSKVDCGGFDALLGALCKSCGIPARVVSGFWVGYKHNNMHAWLEVLLPNEAWLPIDPSVEQLYKIGRTNKYASLGTIGSDRLITGIGEDLEIDKIKVGILQNPFVTSHQKDVEVKTVMKSSRV